MITLQWVSPGGDQWFRLETVDLTNVMTSGVYVIWHDGTPGRVVRLGQGDIAERLTAHRNDPEIVACSRAGTLRVTWAYAPANQRDGIERYLADQLKPLFEDDGGQSLPMAVPMAVNSPW
jgi:hypothetical protein